MSTAPTHRPTMQIARPTMPAHHPMMQIDRSTELTHLLTAATAMTSVTAVEGTASPTFGNNSAMGARGATYATT